MSVPSAGRDLAVARKEELLAGYPDSGSESLGHMTSQLRNVNELYIYLLGQIPISDDL